MSSISQDEKERLAREFYTTKLLPLSRAAAAAGMHYFPLGPDPARGTYFVKRMRTRWTAADFESQSVAAPAQLAPALAALWQATGDPQLAALAPDFAALAAQVYDVDTETDAVTPFMYVMF
jgi:hypothetical protein